MPNAPSKKLMEKFIENSLENLGYVGVNFKDHHVTGRRRDGVTSWYDNARPITSEQAHDLIDRRFK